MVSITTTIIFTLLAIPLVSAGQHTGSRFRGGRRHHARMIQPDARAAPCEESSWQCSGSELQRCVGSQWIPIQTCSGQDIICSTEAGSTGCVWAWAVAQPSANPSVSGPPSVSSNPAIGPSPTSTEDEEDLPECDAEDLGESPSASVTKSSSASSDVPVQSVIGGNLNADTGHSWYSRPSAGADWNQASSSSAWSAVASGDWSNGSPSTPPSSGWSASATSTGQGQWGRPTATDAWAPASPSVSDWQSTSNGSFPTTPSSGYGGANSTVVVSATVTVTGLAPPVNTTRTVPDSSGNGSPGHWGAPHYVVYSDYWLHTMPDVSDLTDFNRFILAFWMSDRGAVDNAQMWEWTDTATRQKVLDSYHNAGIALMVSAFGSTDSPVTAGVDPTDCARRLAAWVKQYNLDGVDIDWEDMQAMNTNKGESWLITFQSELRAQLPAGQYLISHAPVAPWFTSGPDYESGAYVKVHQEVGDGIDFYNIQFYNQGQGVYEDCNSLIFNSGSSSWPSTSALEINSFAGVPYSKIVIGKPISAGAASNGYMDPATLSQCVKQAEDAGWNGGIMYWEWNSDAPRIMAISRGH